MPRRTPLQEGVEEDFSLAPGRQPAGEGRGEGAHAAVGPGWPTRGPRAEAARSRSRSGAGPNPTPTRNRAASKPSRRCERLVAARIVAPMARPDEAEAIFRKRFSCSQAVLAAYA